VLDYFSVEKKKNEYSACIAILHPLLVKGRILTTDAGIGYTRKSRQCKTRDGLSAAWEAVASH
jgi:hypothetical protein